MAIGGNSRRHVFMEKLHPSLNNIITTGMFKTISEILSFLVSSTYKSNIPFQLLKRGW